MKCQGSKCKCGSTTHSRTSHRDCPLKRRKVYIAPSEDLDVLVSGSDDSDTVSKEVFMMMTCYQIVVLRSGFLMISVLVGH